MKKQVKSVALASVLWVVAVSKVKIMLKTTRSHDLTLVNIEAISGEHEEGEGGNFWNCLTMTTYVEVQMVNGECMGCGKNHKVSEWHTRECNKGLFSNCYPGYYVYYFDCEGKQCGFTDRTDISGCSFF